MLAFQGVAVVRKMCLVRKWDPWQRVRKGHVRQAGGAPGCHTKRSTGEPNGANTWICCQQATPQKIKRVLQSDLFISQFEYHLGL